MTKLHTQATDHLAMPTQLVSLPATMYGPTSGH